jgi:hypothetical protein
MWKECIAIQLPRQLINVATKLLNAASGECIIEGTSRPEEFPRKILLGEQMADIADTAFESKVR